MFRRSLLLSAALTLAAPCASWADSRVFNRPNVDAITGPVSARLNNDIFVNQGLVGTVRLSPNTRDFNGDVLGSISALQIDLSTWRRVSAGYTGTLFGLSDRGPTAIDYAPRVHRFSLNFTPYTGAADLPSTTQQGTLTPTGGVLLRDSTGQVFTGRNPLNTAVIRNNFLFPTPPSGDPGAGKVSLDSEGLAFLRDGTFYVSDEYGPIIHYFDASGRQIGAIAAPADIFPRVGGVPFFGPNDTAPPGSTGRRSEQGYEGISVSPDGSRLVTILQSATLQDNPANSGLRRNNTRLVVYDISTNPTPGSAAAEFVLQLPVYNINGAGQLNASAGATAGAREILALNNTQFLVLTGDENGGGAGTPNPIVFKSVLLVDTAGATNLIGTPFAGTTPISTTITEDGTGVLEPSIVPLQQTELINMLNFTELTRFGINLNTQPSNQFTLSNKFEALGLAPVLEEAKPQDFLLLVANDNGGARVGAAGDNVIMFYRLTLPTYIDPLAQAALQGALPLALSQARLVAGSFGTTPLTTAISNVGAVRRAHWSGVDVDGARLWAQGGPQRVASPGSGGRLQGGNVAVGAEIGDEQIRVGLALTGSEYRSDAVGGFDLDGKAYGGSMYGAFFAEAGLYVEIAGGFTQLRMDMTRPAAYGQIATSEPRGTSLGANLQVGYAAKVGDFRVGPVADVVYNYTVITDFQERGASVGNGRTENVTYGRMEATLGAEAVLSQGPVRPSLRLGYTFVRERGDNNVRLQLAAVNGSAATLPLTGADKSFISGEVALEGEVAGFAWRAGVAARDTVGGTSGQAFIGLSKTF